jgi:hypothetical protein
MMDYRTLLIELMLAGFFAVACIRCSMPPAIEGRVRFGDLLRLPGRLERLRRTRWQWFSMVALLLVVRLQMGVPVVLEVTVALMFALFVALPGRNRTALGVRAR